MGCISVKSNDVKYPAFSPVEAPQLETITRDELSGVSAETTRKLLTNDQKLKDYSKRLAAQIQAYNDWINRQK